MEVGEEGEIYTYHCHHQNNSCIRMGRDASPFNVLLIVSGKVAKTQTTTFFEEKGGPKRNRADFINCKGQSYKTTNHNLFEGKGERSGIKPRPFSLPA